jgi:hypothetical protein
MFFWLTTIKLDIELEFDDKMCISLKDLSNGLSRA